MHHSPLLLTLTGALAGALLFGYAARRLGLSPIVGYLLAGILIGPHTPGIVANESLAAEMAEIGIILLMFGVGLQFHLAELLAVRRVALPGALVQIGIATGLGMLAARLFGWSWSGGLLFGIAISVASTVVLIRVLSDHGALERPEGRIAIGWLVVEDLFTVLALVLLPPLLAGGNGPGAIGLAFALASGKLLLLAGFVFVAGKRLLPGMLAHVERLGSPGLFILAVLTIALGIAVGAAQLFGASMALGAFLAGMVVGQSEFGTRAADKVLPFRDVFAVVFFVSIGMLLDPSALLHQAPLVALTLAVILVGKPLAAAVVVRVLNYPFAVGLAISVALAQIGEFSFILAALGRKLDVLPPEATNVLVAASILSIALNPFLFRWTGPLARRVEAVPWLDRLLNPRSD